MGVYGPAAQYPPRLQGVVTHAERFCALLGRWENFSAAGAPAAAKAWVAGRSSEIALVLEHAVADERSGRRSEEDVRRRIADYLEDLHDGARGALGFEGELDCCCDEVFLTEVASLEAPTRVAQRVGAPRGEGEDTWCDPARVLEVSAAVASKAHPGWLGALPGRATSGR
jgi:hypothetical protein